RCRGRQRRRHLGRDPDAGRDRGIHERVDARIAEHLEHGLLGSGIRADVAIGEEARHSAISAAYASAVSSSGSSVKRTAIIHPAPNGSEFTSEGSSTTAWLVSTTSPSSGA